MLLLRLLNGAALSMLWPVVQSFIAVQGPARYFHGMLTFWQLFSLSNQPAKGPQQLTPFSNPLTQGLDHTKERGSGLRQGDAARHWHVRRFERDEAAENLTGLLCFKLWPSDCLFDGRRVLRNSGKDGEFFGMGRGWS